MFDKKLGIVAIVIAAIVSILTYKAITPKKTKAEAVLDDAVTAVQKASDKVKEFKNDVL